MPPLNLYFNVLSAVVLISHNVVVFFVDLPVPYVVILKAINKKQPIETPIKLLPSLLLSAFHRLFYASSFHR